MAHEKVYDEAYFEHWYRRSAVGVGADDFVARKVRLAVAATEYLLGRPIARVLDVGCGGGFLLEELARRGYSGTGIDLSPESVAIANQRLDEIGAADRLKAEVGSAYEPPAGPYDLVTLTDVLEHLEDPRACLRVPHAGPSALTSSRSRCCWIGTPGAMARCGRWPLSSGSGV